jgi:hypothetical protein
MAVKTLRLGCSWWYLPCHVVLHGPSPNPLLGTLMAIKIICLGCSWWFSPCHFVLCGPSLHGPTSISLLWLYKVYICVPHCCWVVTPITWNFIGWWKPCCLGCSCWFSPCHVVLRGPSLHGPTSISLLWLYKGYICVPHWCWVVAPITWDFGYKNPVSGGVHVGFCPVTSC